MTKEDAKARSKALVSRMTLEEKVAQMRHEAPAIPRLGVPAYNWWNECLHGVGRAGTATVFPQAIGMAATFDPELMHEVGVVVSDEARAKHHESLRQGDRGIYKGLTYWTPNINIFRDPRWGRGHETYGEDPFLTSRLAVAFIRALQGDVDDSATLKLVATAKHFAAHSGPEGGRHSFDARVRPKDLYETYLPAFEAAVKEGGVAAIMGAYNRLNGEPCNGSPTLLQGILRDAWGFEGHVVSDCGAICDIDEYHKFLPTRAQAAAYAVRGGVDLNCGGAYEHLLVAVQEGDITEDEITTCVERLFEARYRLGMFDEDCAYAHIPYEIVDCESHRELSREVARKSAVLIKNDGVLPLNADLNAIAVIGPAAQDDAVLLGNYNGYSSHLVSLLDGIQRAVSPMTRVYYARGCDWAKPAAPWAGGSSTYEAVSCAMRAEVVILCLGLNPTMEGEEGDAYNGDASGDRVRIELPEAQRALFEAVAAVGKPMVVLLTGGSAIAMPDVLDRANAVMQVFYPGGEGGTAVAELVFGEESPSGRMPFTVYRATEDLPAFDSYAMEGRTYRYFQGEPLVPFGFGLSYTRFAYGNLRAPDVVRAGDALNASIVVENLGDRKADEIVQVYLSGEGLTEVRRLVAVQRVTVPAGGVFTIPFEIPAERLLVVGEDGASRFVPGRYALHIGGGQPDARSRALGAPKCETREVTFA